MTITDQNSVPLAPLLQAFRKSGLTAGTLAARCGVMRKDGARTKGDGVWVKRTLRLSPEYRAGKQTWKKHDRVYYRTAERLALGLGLDPVDVGL